jgi:ankyrin repeat protein
MLEGGGISLFERAADAIVNGDSAVLAALLRERPELVLERSKREHHSTLLHYVSANGVEDERQKTPLNILAIAAMLLDAGADVNAESDAYGGRATTLDLTATSCHPEVAGVQIALMELLLNRGAALDVGGSSVNACLRNGRGAAAEFLADRGARLDLEGGAGVGRLGTVEAQFDAATTQQRHAAFAWACEFGRTSVVEYLLRRGIAVDAKLTFAGETALHWAAFGGHGDIVKMLLERAASRETKDERWGATPLGWAQHASRSQVIPLLLA